MATEDLIINSLKNRKQFLFVAQGVRASGRFLSLQARKNINNKSSLKTSVNTKSCDSDENNIPNIDINKNEDCQDRSQNEIRRSEISSNEIRYGVTASKKVGNAVKRNFAKRRLRVLFNTHLKVLGTKGFDYVAVARPQTTEASWKDLENDFCFLLKKLSKTLIKSQKDFKPY